MASVMTEVFNRLFGATARGLRQMYLARLNRLLLAIIVRPSRLRNWTVTVYRDNQGRIKWRVDGEPDIILVVGPPGAGKTAFLERIAEDKKLMPGSVLSPGLPPAPAGTGHGQATGEREHLTSTYGNVAFDVVQVPLGKEDVVIGCRPERVVGVVCVLDVSLDTLRLREELVKNRSAISVLKDLGRVLKREVPFLVLGNKCDTLDLTGVVAATTEIERCIHEGGFVCEGSPYFDGKKHRKVQYFHSSTGEMPQGYGDGLAWLSKRMARGNMLYDRC